MTDLRYPIGRFDMAAPLTAETRVAAIADLAALPAQLRAAVNGLTPAQLDTPYRPDGWTVRQLVHHLADSHMNAVTRVRLALTEETPTIKPYDEKGWAALADARTLAVEPSLALLEGLHTRWVVLLQSLGADAFARTVVHPQHGRTMSIDTLTALYAWHGRHHVRHITALRERSGWPAAR
ncbi:MAG: putative metal-dependent hydrolase [Gemmatimonadota bacterium]|nr:putative metal-dependent hydrolase [Gemmatimonadota bacterium]